MKRELLSEWSLGEIVSYMREQILLELSRYSKRRVEFEWFSHFSTTERYTNTLGKINFPKHNICTVIGVYNFPIARETGAPPQVESYQTLQKRYLMSFCLTLSIMRYGSRVKCGNPGKEYCSLLHLGVVDNEYGAFGLQL